MINNSKTCTEPYCEGRMKFKKQITANDNGAYSTEFSVDVFECEDCGAQDFD